jgi:two-component system nitrate/nitrite response regulator NarL
MAIDPFDADLQQLPRSAPCAGTRAKVLVVDDDLLVAETFVFALVQRGFAARFSVPATLHHIQDAIAWNPDLALLDVDLVEGDPIKFVEFFRRSGVVVAVMGANSHRELLLRCADAGAAAVVESSRPLEELVRLLETLVTTTDPRETEWRPPPVAVASVPLPSRLVPFAILTPREQSVLAELMEGRTADAIAKSGWVAVSTVRSQIKSILQKLGVNSQLAAVAFARQAGWSHVGTADAPSTRSFGRRAGDNPLAG